MAEYPDVPIMWIYPTGELQFSLRRYYFGENRKCTNPDNHGYCDARTIIGKIKREDPKDVPPRSDPRWPAHCACGYHFTDKDEWQPRYLTVYRNQPGTWEGTLSEAPPGSVYDATWYPDTYKVDGEYLVVVCPDGSKWEVSSRASNCDKKDDDLHKCWVRHGRAQDGTLHVDKNGLTCNAGAGSIQTLQWHGFCSNGRLQAQR